MALKESFLTGHLCTSTASLRMRNSSLLLGLVLVIGATPLSAQRQGRLAIEGTLGLVRARTGIPFTSHGALAVDALVSFRLRKAPGQSATVGASASRFYKGGDDASCEMLSDGSCAPSLPNFSSRGLLLGWEALSRAGESARVMLGPVWFRRDYRDTLFAGFQGRLDLGTHMTGRLGAVVSARWSYLPSFRDRAMSCHALGFGFIMR